MDQQNFANNATRLVLEAIGNPYGGCPKTPNKDISPRVGFAYDLSGDGRRVLRGGYGLYFDQYNTAASAGDITSQNRRPLNALATLTNTAIGVGQLATFRFGIDPLPPQPTEGNTLPLELDRPVDRSEHSRSAHAPGAHRLRAHARGQYDALGRLHAHRGTERVSAVGTSIRSSTARGCWRRTSQRVFGIPDVPLSDVNILAAINKSRYDALTFMFQRRFPRATLQAHYTLAGAYSYGGSTGNRSGAGSPQDYVEPLATG